MRIGAAGRLKTAVRAGKTLQKIIASRSAERFVRAPAAGGKTLRGEESKSIRRRAKMLFAAQCEIGLSRRAERIDVAICMTPCKIAVVLSERVIVNVVEIVLAERLVSFACAALVGQE